MWLQFRLVSEPHLRTYFGDFHTSWSSHSWIGPRSAIPCCCLSSAAELLGLPWIWLPDGLLELCRARGMAHVLIEGNSCLAQLQPCQSSPLCCLPRVTLTGVLSLLHQGDGGWSTSLPTPGSPSQANKDETDKTFLSFPLSGVREMVFLWLLLRYSQQLEGEQCFSFVPKVSEPAQVKMVDCF